MFGPFIYTTIKLLQVVKDCDTCVLLDSTNLGQAIDFDILVVSLQNISMLAKLFTWNDGLV